MASGTDFNGTRVMAVFSNSEPEHCITIETYQSDTSSNETFKIELNLTGLIQRVVLPDAILVNLVNAAPPMEATTREATTREATEAVTFSTVISTIG